ncbi:MAG: hypothetical protein ACLTZY_00925 [Alistipes indistinctus]
MSSYIWRGFYNAGASIQPTLGMKAGGFALTAWWFGRLRLVELTKRPT